MPNDEPTRRAPSETPDLKVSLAWEAIGALTEKVNDLDLQVSVSLIALAKTLPGFAQEFERAYDDAVAQQRKSESELPLSVQRAIRQLRKP